MSFTTIRVVSALLAGSCAIVVVACGRPASSSTGPPAPPAAVAVPAAGQASQALPQEVAAIVDAYRKIIVLVEDESSLPQDDRPRASLVGRLLYQQNHDRLATLTERLLGELGATTPPAQASAFLDVLEQHAELRDADKLAFMDLISELVDAARESRPNSPARALLSRLQSDLDALKQIQALYNKELEKIFGRFETRGMAVRREAWETYVAFLKSRYRATDIVKEQEASVGTVRGIAASTASSGSALEITGARLPAKTLVLTFDDGPHAKHTDRIREILAKYDVPAVFFHVGQNLGTIDAAKQIHATRATAASVRLVEAGHVIANHTFSHDLLPKLTDSQIATQIEQGDRLLRTVANPPGALFRPPYGARNEGVLAAVQARSLKNVLWNIDSRDWADPVPQSIANRVIQLAEGERRGIVLFHDIQARTVDALPPVIETLQQRGYRFVGWNGSEFGGGAGTAVAEQKPAAPARALYRESWAVVVGIDQYKHWARLSYAGNDARAMRELLIDKFGFKAQNVTLLLNEQATRDRILSAIGDVLADPARVAREDRVFVFFAGHGATRKLPNGRALGYIVPVEADLANYQGQAISMTNFQDMSEAIPAKHVFFVTDACYSGLAATRGGAQNYLQEVTRRVARQVLTAGGADQQVADNGPNGHSIFTWTLMQGLDGRADLNGDNFITASELAAYVGPTVSSLSQQTPAFASLPGSEGGEFVFELKHETEFLSQESGQLDAEAIKLNTELDKIRAEIAAKRARNEQLKREIASARAALDGSAVPATPAGPATAAQLNDRGTTLFREKRYAEALEVFLDAAKLNPSNALVANNVGFAFYKLEKYEPAVEWFEKTIKLDARRAIAHANLGDAYLALGKRAEARRAYERYLELQPTAKYAATVREKLQQRQ